MGNDITATDYLLLTGAGFTKNFGGFVASEMWSQIFNSRFVQESKYLRKALGTDFDYESVYSDVIGDPNASAEDKERIASAMLSAYKVLDDNTRNWVFTGNGQYPVNWYLLNELISLFQDSGTSKGFFFTLNQDLFYERRTGMPTPGVAAVIANNAVTQRQELTDEHFVTLPSENVEELVRRSIGDHAGLHYIKLHGSYGWRSSDGSNQMVIGKNKTTLIEREPLLRHYFELLRSVILQGNKKILVIGYGFGDRHVNELLMEGVVSHGLRLYIISTQAPAALRKKIEEEHSYALPMLDGLSGYFPNQLVEIFPGDQRRTPLFENIMEALRRN